MRAAPHKSLSNRARSWLSSSTTIGHQVLHVSWSETQRICHGRRKGEWFVHQYHSSVRTTFHSGRDECQQQPYVFPGPVLYWIPSRWPLGWMVLIPNVCNWVWQCSKSLIMSGTINPLHLGYLFPPEKRFISTVRCSQSRP